MANVAMSCIGSNRKAACEVFSVSKKVDMERNGLGYYEQERKLNSRKSSIDTNHNCSSNSDSLHPIMSGNMSDEVKQSMPGLQQKKGVRFIRKTGHCNVSHSNMSDKPRRFISDIFTTGVDLQWRWNLLVFSSTFVFSWIFFGLIYWFGSHLHGDFQAENIGNTSFRSCVNNLDSKHPFTSSFLFSLETQTTIGYGFRVVTEECPFTIFMVVVQSVFGCILDAFMIGLIMAKISRPKKRAETLLFSDNAVINVRDGQLCLMIRVGNLRKSHLVEATIRMQFVHSRTTLEGEFIPLEQIDLHLDLKNDSDRLFLVTPQTICHPIDENSPLYDLHPDKLSQAQFEIVVILEGMVEATGMTTQARASYLPNEILWGHRFQNMISFTKRNGYKVNFQRFNETYCTPDAPWLSASTIAEKEDVQSIESSLYKSKTKSSNDDTSSSRSSVTGCHHNPSHVSEGRDSGYTAVEDLVRSCSTQTLNTDHNKPLTSTTSLSDDYEEDAATNNRNDTVFAQNHQRQLSKSQNSASGAENDDSPAIELLVDVQDSPKVDFFERTRQSASFRKPNPPNPELNKSAHSKSSNDVRLLFVDESPNTSLVDVANFNRTPMAPGAANGKIITPRADDGVCV